MSVVPRGVSIAVMLLAALGVAFIAARVGTLRASYREQADSAWAARCTESCAARLAASGEACFRVSYTPEGRRSKAALDTARFVECVDIGADAWLARQAARTQPTDGVAR